LVIRTPLDKKLTFYQKSSIIEQVERIRVVWLPMNKPGIDTNYATDVLEVADCWIKMKDLGRKYNKSVRVALAKSWMPRNVRNQTKALRIFRLNLALEVLAYNWLRTRCIDLSRLTMELSKDDTVITPDNVMEIPGFDDHVFLPKAYRNMESDPMEVSYFSGRRAREQIRRVMKIHGVEPDWLQALNSEDKDEHIPVPGLTARKRYEEFPKPEGGAEKCHEKVMKRIQVRYMYEAGLSEDNYLPPTGLEEYNWKMLNAQSNDFSKPKEEYKKTPISRGNLLGFQWIPYTKSTLPAQPAQERLKKPMSERLNPPVRAGSMETEDVEMRDVEKKTLEDAIEDMITELQDEEKKNDELPEEVVVLEEIISKEEDKKPKARVEEKKKEEKAARREEKIIKSRDEEKKKGASRPGTPVKKKTTPEEEKIEPEKTKKIEPEKTKKLKKRSEEVKTSSSEDESDSGDSSTISPDSESTDEEERARNVVMVLAAMKKEKRKARAVKEKARVAQIEKRKNRKI